MPAPQYMDPATIQRMLPEGYHYMGWATGQFGVGSGPQIRGPDGRVSLWPPSKLANVHNRWKVEEEARAEKAAKESRQRQAPRTPSPPAQNAWDMMPPEMREFHEANVRKTQGMLPGPGGNPMLQPTPQPPPPGTIGGDMFRYLEEYRKEWDEAAKRKKEMQKFLSGTGRQLLEGLMSGELQKKLLPSAPTLTQGNYQRPTDAGRPTFSAPPGIGAMAPPPAMPALEPRPKYGAPSFTPPQLPQLAAMFGGG